MVVHLFSHLDIYLHNNILAVISLCSSMLCIMRTQKEDETIQEGGQGQQRR